MCENNKGLQHPQYRSNNQDAFGDKEGGYIAASGEIIFPLF